MDVLSSIEAIVPFPKNSSKDRESLMFNPSSGLRTMKLNHVVKIRDFEAYSQNQPPSFRW